MPNRHLLSVLRNVTCKCHIAVKKRQGYISPYVSFSDVAFRADLFCVLKKQKKNSKNEGRARSTKCVKQKYILGALTWKRSRGCPTCVKYNTHCTCSCSSGSGLSKSRFFMLSCVKCTFLTFHKDRCSQWEFCLLFDALRNALLESCPWTLENRECIIISAPFFFERNARIITSASLSSNMTSVSLVPPFGLRKRRIYHYFRPLFLRK